jgi:hypothetical protein
MNIFRSYLKNPFALFAKNIATFAVNFRQENQTAFLIQ